MMPKLSIASVDTELPLDVKTSQLFAICQELMPEWSSLQETDITVSPISGGISNMTLKFTPKTSLAPVAVKLFGDKTEILIDRNRERRNLVALNAAGFGATVLGFYANGRVEKFLIAKTLEPTDMSSPVYMPRIAKRLQAFHKVRIEGTEVKDNLFDTIRGWLAIVKTLTFPDPEKQEAFDHVDLQAMESELEEIAEVCSTTSSPVVFSHNDLLSGNILELRDGSVPGSQEQDLQFIDFEYSEFCPRGFDFGNHFNEFAGFDCDYSLYPSEEIQKAFFRSYLQAGGMAADESVLTAMVAEANVYSLASHMYWGIWALVQARYSVIDFDYLTYSTLRWDQYYKTKDAFVQQARSTFTS